MLILVSGGTAAVRRYPYRDCLGGLITPRTGNDPQENYVKKGMAWAMDNDCFQKLDKEAYIAMLKRCRDIPGCLWVSAPDIVADAEATLVRFKMWQPVLNYYGYPIAFVLQDGAKTIPWNKFHCLFIGGSTEYKLSPKAEEYVRAAKLMGKWVHMGRVNGRGRLLYAGSIGCDSVDGTGFSKFSNATLPWGIEHARVVQTRMEIA